MAKKSRTSEHASALYLFARELHRRRTRAGLSQEQLADQMGYSQAQISHIEQARRVPQPDLARRLDTFFDTGGLFAELWELINQEASRLEQFKNFLNMELHALEIRTYEPYIVPGLFQTEDYMRTVFEAKRPALPTDEIDSRTALRLSRQERLESSENPLSVWAVIDESALRRPVGGAATMRRQTERLIELSTLPNVTIQVLPMSVGMPPGMGRALVILKFPESPTTVYLEEETTALYIRDDLDQVGNYKTIFNHLQATADREDLSRDRLKDLAKGWE